MDESTSSAHSTSTSPRQLADITNQLTTKPLQAGKEYPIRIVDSVTSGNETSSFGMYSNLNASAQLNIMDGPALATRSDDTVRAELQRSMDIRDNVAATRRQQHRVTSAAREIDAINVQRKSNSKPFVLISTSKENQFVNSSSSPYFNDLQNFAIKDPLQIGLDDPAALKEDATDEDDSFHTAGEEAEAEKAGVGHIKMSKDENDVEENQEFYESVDEGEDDELGENGAPLNNSDFRRVQDANFASYLHRKALQEARTLTNKVDQEHEKQTLRSLVKQAEGEQIIATPRDYQLELFEKAKIENIIAVLDTGSGKTLIAVLLLRHVINQELEDRALGKPKRISIFLVDSVTLVFQQHAVLECNLDYPMDRFCGEMGCDLWSKDHWDKHFSENMVIVCTADVLYQCLHHSFITMDRINLLIFDEAHHAKKNHSYARIIKDFYLSVEDKSKRPKIFGMTASPVDARVDVKKAASELETLLHCKIATAADSSLMQFSSKSKIEKVVEYSPLVPPFETPLYQKLKEQVSDSAVLAKAMRFSKQASSELGAWCSDSMWPICLDDDEVKKILAKTERKFHERKTSSSLDELEEQKSKIEQARSIVEGHEFPAPKANLTDLSSKTLVLVHWLRERFERPTNDKCIVFVRQRYTATILTRLFQQVDIATPHINVGTLVGTRTGEAGDLNASFKQQVITMMRFREGKLNCLFATSVAEEGLDVPDCNLIVRFDLYHTLIQYIQSRGRARQMNSIFIHMKEQFNRQHQDIIKEVYRNENILRKFCLALPEDRLLTGNDCNINYLLRKERHHQTETEAETGAVLTYRMSLAVLGHFAGSLPKSEDSASHPVYLITVQNHHFICEVILPETSPISGVIGRPASTKREAKCAAAFETCKLLRRKKHLDKYWLPTYTKKLPAMHNARLALNSKMKHGYPMRTKPAIWSVDQKPQQLFITVLDVSSPERLGRESQPLALLTRAKLPQLPLFPVYLEGSVPTPVVMTSVEEPLIVDDSVLENILTFNIRSFDDVFSKLFERDLNRMPYFLAPIAKRSITTSKAHEMIDWQCIDFVAKHEHLLWDETTPDSFFENRFVHDPYDGSRKMWSKEVTKKYKPLDPVPPGTVERSGARRNNDNIMEYSISLFRKSRQRVTFREDQPVIEAEYIPLRRNLLDKTGQQLPEKTTKMFVIPEPLRISPLPTSVVAMLYLFPAIIHRIESHLITLEACNLLRLDVRADLALEAMTKDSDNTEAHGKEQVAFQRGMGNNYERLEFLGDCFLKMATSISLFTLNPDSNEMDFHVKRMCLICNANLQNVSQKLNLHEFIRSRSFDRRGWYPEGLVLKRGKRPKSDDESKKHVLGDKTIADVSEALIGAALLTHHDSKNMDPAVHAVSELVCSADHTMAKFADYYLNYKLPKYQTAPSTAAQRNLAEKIELQHGYHFKHPRLLRSAFAHPSYPTNYEKVPNYQRLEFLGDALLDMACINFIFHRFPSRDPQWLTEHKMAMVSNQFLGALCVKLGFHRHLLYLHPAIGKRIKDYVDEIEEAKNEAIKEAIQSGKSAEDYSRDYWVHTTRPPKCLPDMVEAYIGAVFVDSEFNYNEVERFFEENILWFFEDMHLYDTFANKQPTTYLTNFLSVHMGCTRWRIRTDELPANAPGLSAQVFAGVMVHNDMIADGIADSGRYAKIAASKQALSRLQGLSPQQFRATFKCDCKPKDADAMELEEDETRGTAV